MKGNTVKFAIFTALLTMSAALYAADLHVATNGKDTNPATRTNPLRTIQCAANLAQPGDTIIVHEGVYRERVNPPRGGASDARRIVYQAAEGEKVEIKGSEIIKNWVKVHDDVWKVTLPNSFFGNFNPYHDDELIKGEWCGTPADGYARHTGAVYLNGHWFPEAEKLDDVLKPVQDSPLWFAEVDDWNTTIYARFKGVNPNEQFVEINVRQSIFYPDQPGRNYITVRGFTMRHAATPWSGAMSEQIGLIGTHWSKGWIIENNVISHSMNTGITLGRYDLGRFGIAMPAVSAPGFIESVRLATEHGWSKEKIGSHVIRNNHISYCEKNGIHGSLGGIFSVIEGNTICYIGTEGWINGADIAGLKLLGSIDTVIKDNCFHDCTLGLWLDWMAQGTRVTGNLLHDNSTDMFMEVNHGPFLVDNNIFLSPVSIVSRSQGGAYGHNLIAGKISPNPLAKGGVPVNAFDSRLTPFHKAHSTEIAALHDNPCGDDRWYNNVLVAPADLTQYDMAQLPVWMSGNVFLDGARSSKYETDPLVKPDFDPQLKLVDKADGLYLVLDKVWSDEQKRKLVTAELLGKAVIPDLPYEQPDGTPIRIDTDYLGRQRNETNPAPGPFEKPGSGRVNIKVWPKQ